MTAVPVSGTRSQEGSALPLVLFALMMLYMLGGAGFTQSTIELIISRNHRRSVEAFYTADGGLQHFLGTTTDLPPEKATFSLPAGAADVTAEPLLLAAPGLWLYRVEAAASLPLGAGGHSRRTVGTIVLAAEPSGLGTPGTPPVSFPGTWYELF